MNRITTMKILLVISVLWTDIEKRIRLTLRKFLVITKVGSNLRFSVSPTQEEVLLRQRQVKPLLVVWMDRALNQQVSR